jgi:hypothetical protein
MACSGFYEFHFLCGLPVSTSIRYLHLCQKAWFYTRPRFIPFSYPSQSCLVLLKNSLKWLLIISLYIRSLFYAVVYNILQMLNVAFLLFVILVQICFSHCPAFASI